MLSYLAMLVPHLIAVGRARVAASVLLRRLPLP
jgi:hypothetical protein